MEKSLPSEVLNFANQTLPFLMITVTFITIAYIYGHTANSMTSENPFDASRIDISHLL